MKRIMLIVFTMLFTLTLFVANAEAQMDFSAMTMEELHSVYNAVRNEIALRKNMEAEENVYTLNFEKIDVSVIIHSWKFSNAYGDSRLDFECSVYNNSDVDVEIGIDEEYINGWMVLEDGFYSSVAKLPAGRKIRESFSIDELEEMAEITAVEDLTELEALFFVREKDSYSAEYIDKQTVYLQFEEQTAPAEKITEIQGNLCRIGLMSEDQINGIYDDTTVEALKRFQEWVNEMNGTETVEVRGTFDDLTLQFLEYCVESGFSIS